MPQGNAGSGDALRTLQFEGTGGARHFRRRGGEGRAVYPRAQGFVSRAAGSRAEGKRNVCGGGNSEEFCLRPRREAGGAVDRYAHAEAVSGNAGQGGTRVTWGMPRVLRRGKPRLYGKLGL